MYSLKAVVKSLVRTFASLAVVRAVEGLVEPKVVDVGPDSALGPKTSWVADLVLKGSGPMMVEAELGQVLVPMDLHLHGDVLEIVPGLFEPKVAVLGLDFGMESRH